MYKQRREIIKSVAGFGAMSASLMALGSGTGRAAGLASSAQAQRDVLKGPYLDLTTGKGNQIALARMIGDLDESKQKHGWYKGFAMAVQPDKKVEDLVGFMGFDASRLEKREDGSFARLLREVVLYTDLRSGEVLEEWYNPYIDETVPVVHVANDPFNFVLTDYVGPPPSYGGLNEEKAAPREPLMINWQRQDERLYMENHIHMFYPNALQPDKWPRESAGTMARVSEMYTYFVDIAKMQDESFTTLPFSGTWSRITPWLPWMLMGQTPGHCQYLCFHGAGQELDEVMSRPVLDYIEKNYAKYFKAPDAWEEPSLSSLEHYSREQTPAPPKK
jgi:hypothetical protein